jgi:peptidoglycan/xylan/chitin deacetylase (PgdA/CDA1 family)/GT2 family glycosyltransferase
VVELSVVIATYDRAERLGVCLQALEEQTSPHVEFEVVVVVDGSTDGTRELLARLTPSYRMRVVEQANLGQCTALNRGAATATGRICLFMDDDIVAGPDLIGAHLRLHRQQESIVGIGRMILALPPSADWFALGFAREWDAHYERLGRAGVQPTWADCYGGNLSVPRSAFLTVGGFATDLSRLYDLELGYRLAQHGCRFVYLASAAGAQDERKGFRELARDAEQGGAAAVEIARRFPATLPRLLGHFGEARLLETLLCRALLALDTPPPLLAPVGRALAGLRSRRRNAWFRFLHRYCYWRGVRRGLRDPVAWQRLARGTSILMYHAIGAPGEPPSRFILPARRFARQMAWLKRMGYHVLSLDEYLELRKAYRLPPAGSVVITMDDGYLDNWSLAFPILRQYGFPATIFLVSGRLNGANDWDQRSELTGRPLMSPDNIAEMRAGSVGFGAHTRTHRSLKTLSAEQASEEIAGSRTDLEHSLGMPIRSFSYPYGDFDAAHLELAHQAGFQGSCTVRTGLNTPMTPVQALRRVEIWGTDSLLHFLVAVTTGHRSQALWRRVRRSHRKPEASC